MTAQRIFLDDTCFTQCLHQYIIDEKPDPLQKKQLESWKIVWTNNDDNDDLDDNDNTGNKIDSTSNDASNALPDESDTAVGMIPMNFTPSHVVSGRLQISTEYMILTLYTKCVWMGDRMNGSIRFTCHVSAAPNISTSSSTTTNSTMTKSGDVTDVTTKTTKKKDSTRITTTMIERLCRDEYIRKILVSDASGNDTGSSDTNQNRHRYLLCSASMDTKHEQSYHNEERVYCDETIGEAIRRTIYSSSDSVLDIVDILFRLPYLPCTDSHAVTTTTTPTSGGHDGTATTTTTTTTKLADRVRLRLLEEATYDVCDNEPDEEIVDDLSIKDNNHHKDYDDDTDDVNEARNNDTSHAVPSRKNKKMKR